MINIPVCMETYEGTNYCFSYLLGLSVIFF